MLNVLLLQVNDIGRPRSMEAFLPKRPCPSKGVFMNKHVMVCSVMRCKWTMKPSICNICHTWFPGLYGCGLKLGLLKLSCAQFVVLPFRGPRILTYNHTIILHCTFIYSFQGILCLYIHMFMYRPSYHVHSPTQPLKSRTGVKEENGFRYSAEFSETSASWSSFSVALVDGLGPTFRVSLFVHDMIFGSPPYIPLHGLSPSHHRCFDIFS